MRGPSRAGRNGPRQSLKSDVAKLAELRAMTLEEREELTCTTCQITYTSTRAVRSCTAWHNGH